MICRSSGFHALAATTEFCANIQEEGDRRSRCRRLAEFHRFRITFEGDRAKSVTICAAGGHETTISGRHFVFCNGTLEIIRFFLSTAKTSAVPWRNNYEIGKRYQDHPCGKVATAHILDEKKFRDFFENAIVGGAVKLFPKVRVREEAREKAT